MKIIVPEWKDIVGGADEGQLSAGLRGGIAILKATVPDNALERVAILSEEEKTRLSRISHKPTANSFVAGRVLIRSVLGALCSAATGVNEPAYIDIQLLPSGKPVAGGDARFSLTHSDNHLLLALSRSSEIGIDLECLDRIDDPAGLARTAFAADEAREILAAADPRREFLLHWTRKESIIKCRGTTLAGDIHNFYSGFDPARLAADISTASFILDERRLGALSCFGPIPELRWFNLNGFDMFCRR